MLIRHCSFTYKIFSLQLKEYNQVNNQKNKLKIFSEANESRKYQRQLSTPVITILNFERLRQRMIFLKWQLSYYLDALFDVIEIQENKFF